MVTLTANGSDKFSINVTPVPPGSVIDGPPTYPVNNAGLVNISAAADGLSCVVTGLAAGTCTITPTALAHGNTITGTPVDVTVVSPPPVFATSLDVVVSQVTPV